MFVSYNYTCLRETDLVLSSSQISKVVATFASQLEAVGSLQRKFDDLKVSVPLQAVVSSWVR